MTMNSSGWARGDVVMVDVPYLDAAQTVRRPALIVGGCGQMLDVIIAAITSRIRDPLPATHYVIGSHHRDRTSSGLRLDSVVRCDRLFTVQHDQLHRKLGTLSPQTMSEVSDVLRIALALA